jgi:hypothetical protein
MKRYSEDKEVINKKEARRDFSAMVEDVHKKIIALSPVNKEGKARIQYLRKKHLAVYVGLADQLISGSTRYLKELVDTTEDDECAVEIVNDEEDKEVETDVWDYEDLCQHVFKVLLSDIPRSRQNPKNLGIDDAEVISN